MSDNNFWSSHIKKDAILSPIDRISEILFGLIMVLTFTGTISATHPGRAELRDLLWSALGCNLAWGIVDAVMYLMNIVLSRAYGIAVGIKCIAVYLSGINKNAQITIYSGYGISISIYQSYHC